MIDDWIEGRRPPVSDEYEREPLIATEHGRAVRTTIQGNVYEATRPCCYGEDCPDGRDPDVCETTSYDSAPKCPYNVSPHVIRRGSSTYLLNQDVPKEVVSERMNVSQKKLEKHYDARTEEEKRLPLRRYFPDG